MDSKHREESFKFTFICQTLEIKKINKENFYQFSSLIKRLKEPYYNQIYQCIECHYNKSSA